MQRLFRLVSVAFLLAELPAVAQREKTDRLEKLLSLAHQKHWFNGALVAGQNGKVIFSKGYGFADFTDSLPFTADTPADGGSNAKTFTAAAILSLVQAGKLKLTDPVQRFLPAYPYANTTVFNLLTHSTGGLPDYGYYFERIADTAVLTTEGFVEILDRFRPDLSYRPNTNFCYDSPGFDLTAAVVEKTTGSSYADFLAQTVFSPLNMKTAFVRPARFFDWKGKRVKGYSYRNDTLFLNDIADREGFYGGSNIWFSATDLYRWGTSFYHRPLFSKALLRAATSRVRIGKKPSAVRLGAWYGGTNPDGFYYWGNLAGFYSWVYWDRKQKFTVAFVSNTDMPQPLRPQFTAALIAIMEGRPQEAIAEQPAALIEKKDSAKISGVYRVPRYGSVAVAVQSGQVLLRLQGGREYKMIAVDKKWFYVPGLEPWIAFRTHRNNRFQEIIWNATIFHAVGKRVSGKGSRHR